MGRGSQEAEFGILEQTYHPTSFMNCVISAIHADYLSILIGRNVLVAPLLHQRQLRLLPRRRRLGWLGLFLFAIGLNDLR